MISIIVCSVKEPLRNALRININNTIGTEHEFLVIENEKTNYSISKAYNNGAHRAKYPFLVFVHEDVVFHTNNWGQHLVKHFQETNARLIGILGATVKTKAHSSVHIPFTKLNRHNQLQRYITNDTDHFYDNPLNEERSEVCVLDGLFIASTKKAWEQTKFSEDYLKGFHGYDIDFSLKNFELGKILVVYDILIEHFSLGTFSKNWIDTQLLVTKKWKKRLPFATKSTSKEDIKNAEVANLKWFLHFLVHHNYKRCLQIGCLVKLFVLLPNPIKYHFLFRKVLLGHEVDNTLKLFFKKLHFLLPKRAA